VLAAADDVLDGGGGRTKESLRRELRHQASRRLSRIPVVREVFEVLVTVPWPHAAYGYKLGTRRKDGQLSAWGAWGNDTEPGPNPSFAPVPM
jgi:hypothetical protein